MTNIDNLQYILVLVTMVIYIFCSVYFNKFNVTYIQIKFIHESGIAIMIGLLVGMLTYVTTGQTISFDSGIFFRVVLPLIVFSAGYNMKRKRFFRNIGAISMFGLILTFLCFVIIACGTLFLSKVQLIYTIDGKVLNICTRDAMIMGATLSASDVLAALTLVNEKQTPRLHSILFGEGVLNDAVAILLFVTIQTIDTESSISEQIFVVTGMFFYNCLASVLVGIIFGYLSAWLLNAAEPLDRWPGHQAALILYIAYMDYMIATYIETSGVISLLVCAIIMAHYSYYNMSPLAQKTSNVMFQILGSGAESFTFIYLGLCTATYSTSHFSLYFMMCTLILVMLSRLISVFGLTYFAKFVTKGKFQLDSAQLGVLWMGGAVRGAIAFGLINSVHSEQAQLMKLTVLGIVLITTIFIGAILPYWTSYLDPTEDYPNKELVEQINEEPGDISSRSHNDILTPQDYERRSTFHRLWNRIDNNYLKPCFIRQRTRKLSATGNPFDEEVANYEMASYNSQNH